MLVTQHSQLVAVMESFV